MTFTALGQYIRDNELSFCDIEKYRFGYTEIEKRFYKNVTIQNGNSDMIKEIQQSELQEALSLGCEYIFIRDKNELIYTRDFVEGVKYIFYK